MVVFPALRTLEAALCCNICYETLSAPVSLVCGHSFCSACIRANIAYKVKHDMAPACPTCRASCEEAGLRANILLREAAAAFKLLGPQLADLIAVKDAALAAVELAAAAAAAPPAAAIPAPAALAAAALPVEPPSASPRRTRRARRQEVTDLTCRPPAARASSPSPSARAVAHANLPKRRAVTAPPTAASGARASSARRDQPAINNPASPSCGASGRDSDCEIISASVSMTTSSEESAASSSGHSDDSDDSDSDVRLSARPAGGGKSHQRASSRAAKRTRLGAAQVPRSAATDAPEPRPPFTAHGTAAAAPPVAPLPPPGKGLVRCPVCSMALSKVALNLHLDGCLEKSERRAAPAALPPPSRPAAGAAGRGRPAAGAQQPASSHLPQAPAPAVASTSAAGAARAPQGGRPHVEAPPKIVWHVVKDKDVRAKLQAMGLPVDGKKQDLVDRYAAYHSYVSTYIDQGCPGDLNQTQVLRNFVAEQQRAALAASRAPRLSLQPGAAACPEAPVTYRDLIEQTRQRTAQQRAEAGAAAATAPAAGAAPDSASLQPSHPLPMEEDGRDLPDVPTSHGNADCATGLQHGTDFGAVSNTHGPRMEVSVADAAAVAGAHTAPGSAADDDVWRECELVAVGGTHASSSGALRDQFTVVLSPRGTRRPAQTGTGPQSSAPSSAQEPTAPAAAFHFLDVTNTVKPAAVTQGALPSRHSPGFDHLRGSESDCCGRRTTSAPTAQNGQHHMIGDSLKLQDGGTLSHPAVSGHAPAAAAAPSGQTAQPAERSAESDCSGASPADLEREYAAAPMPRSHPDFGSDEGCGVRGSGGASCSGLEDQPAAATAHLEVDQRRHQGSRTRQGSAANVSACPSHLPVAPAERSNAGEYDEAGGGTMSGITAQRDGEPAVQQDGTAAMSWGSEAVAQRDDRDARGSGASTSMRHRVGSNGAVDATAQPPGSGCSAGADLAYLQDTSTAKHGAASVQGPVAYRSEPQKPIF